MLRPTQYMGIHTKVQSPALGKTHSHVRLFPGPQVPIFPSQPIPRECHYAIGTPLIMCSLRSSYLFDSTTDTGGSSAGARSNG